MNSQKLKFNLYGTTCLIFTSLSLFALHFSKFEPYRSQAESTIGIPAGYLWIPITVLILGFNRFLFSRIYYKFLKPIKEIADDCVRGGIEEDSVYNQNRETRIISSFIKRSDESATQNKAKANDTEIELSEIRKELNKARTKVMTLESLVASNSRVRESLNTSNALLRSENQKLSRISATAKGSPEPIVHHSVTEH